MKCILSIIILLSCCSAEQVRSWMLSSGQVFEASFSEMANSSVRLKSADGRSTTIPSQQLSIVDLLYLVDEQQVPLEKLERGFQPNIEQKYRPKTSLMRKGDKITLELGKDRLHLTTFSSEHFELWAEERIDFSDCAEVLERAWFYQAWRNPHYREKRKKKTLMIYTTTEEGSIFLTEYFIAARPDLSEQRKSSHRQMMRSNGRDLFLRGVVSEVDERGLHPHARVTRAEKLDFQDESMHHTILAYGTMREYGLYDNSYRRDEQYDQSFNYFIEAMRYDSETSVYEAALTAMHTDMGSKGNFGTLREISRDIKTRLKKGSFTPQLDYLFSMESSMKLEPEFGPEIVAIGRFLRSDLRHELGTARYIQKINKQSIKHTPEELAKTYGYASFAEMEEAYRSFLDQKEW